MAEWQALENHYSCPYLEYFLEWHASLADSGATVTVLPFTRTTISQPSSERITRAAASSASVKAMGLRFFRYSRWFCRRVTSACCRTTFSARSASRPTRPPQRAPDEMLMAAGSSGAAAGFGSVSSRFCAAASWRSTVAYCLPPHARNCGD